MGQDRWAFWGWVVLGLGVLLLAVGIPFSISLIQDSDELGAVLPAGVEVEVQRVEGPSTDSGQAEPAGGGTAERARVEDSVQFVIRDSAGKVKEQGIAQ